MALSLRQQIIENIAQHLRMRGRGRHAPPAARTQRTIATIAKLAATVSGASLLCIGAMVGACIIKDRRDAPAQDRLDATASRGLTMAEAALAHSIFGRDFALNGVTLYFHDGASKQRFNQLSQKPGHATLAYVNMRDSTSIHITDVSYNVSDYARLDDIGWRTNTFMHEMTHVWQSQQAQQAADCEIYDYTLTPQSRFEDFCSEQQARMVGDYVQRFLLPTAPEQLPFALHRESLRRMTHELGVNARDSNNASTQDALLTRVIERQFPAAAASRLRIQDGFRAAAGCIIDAQSASANAVADCNDRHLRTVDGQTVTSRAAVPTAPRSPSPRR